MDEQEPVTVTLRVEDWATIITALSEARISLEVKSRINSTIFACARDTVRTLS